jgi:hypothetical protein
LFARSFLTLPAIQTTTKCHFTWSWNFHFTVDHHGTLTTPRYATSYATVLLITQRALIVLFFILPHSLSPSLWFHSPARVAVVHANFVHSPQHTQELSISFRALQRGQLTMGKSLICTAVLCATQTRNILRAVHWDCYIQQCHEQQRTVT